MLSSLEVALNRTDETFDKQVNFCITFGSKLLKSFRLMIISVLSTTGNYLFILDTPAVDTWITFAIHLMANRLVR